MSAPVLDSLKALDTKLQETKSQELNTQDNKSKDDNPEKKNASDSESVDRFDRENLLCAISGYTFWDSLNQNTNTQNNNKILSVLWPFFYCPGAIESFPCSQLTNILCSTVFQYSHDGVILLLITSYNWNLIQFI